MNLGGLSTVSSLADYLKLESRNQHGQARAAFEELSSELLTCPCSRRARNLSFPAEPRNSRDAKQEIVFPLETQRVILFIVSSTSSGQIVKPF